MLDTNQAVGAGVPELNVRRVEPNSNVSTIGSPANASNRTAVLVDGHKLRCGSARCVPQVHRVAQSNGQHVVAPPVKQVEVVVINEFRCVQSPLRRLRIISGQIRNHHPIDSSTEKQDGHQSVVQCTNLITWGMWRRCLAGLAWWEEAASAAAVFSGSGGLFLKARIRVRLLSSFSASSLRYASPWMVTPPRSPCPSWAPLAGSAPRPCPSPTCPG